MRAIPIGREISKFLATKMIGQFLQSSSLNNTQKMANYGTFSEESEIEAQLF